MELKNFVKKVVVAVLVGSFAVGTLAACSSSSDNGGSTGTMSKTTSDSQSVRGKNSSYSTK